MVFSELGQIWTDVSVSRNVRDDPHKEGGYSQAFQSAFTKESGFPVSYFLKHTKYASEVECRHDNMHFFMDWHTHRCVCDHPYRYAVDSTDVEVRKLPYSCHLQ